MNKMRSDKVSAHSNVRENNTKSEESRRENRGKQKNYANKWCMGNKGNHIQNHRGRFQEEFQRTGRSEMLDWRSKQRGRWSETSCFLHKSKIERQREVV